MWGDTSGASREKLPGPTPRAGCPTAMWMADSQEPPRAPTGSTAAPPRRPRAGPAPRQSPTGPRPTCGGTSRTSPRRAGPGAGGRAASPASRTSRAAASRARPGRSTPDRTRRPRRGGAFDRDDRLGARQPKSVGRRLVDGQSAHAHRRRDHQVDEPATVTRRRRQSTRQVRGRRQADPLPTDEQAGPGYQSPSRELANAANPTAANRSGTIGHRPAGRLGLPAPRPVVPVESAPLAGDDEFYPELNGPVEPAKQPHGTLDLAGRRCSSTCSWSCQFAVTSAKFRRAVELGRRAIVVALGPARGRRGGTAVEPVRRPRRLLGVGHPHGRGAPGPGRRARQLLAARPGTCSPHTPPGSAWRRRPGWSASACWRPPWSSPLREARPSAEPDPWDTPAAGPRWEFYQGGMVGLLLGFVWAVGAMPAEAPATEVFRLGAASAIAPGRPLVRLVRAAGNDPPAAGRARPGRPRRGRAGPLLRARVRRPRPADHPVPAIRPARSGGEPSQAGRPRPARRRVDQAGAGGPRDRRRRAGGRPIS